MSPSLVWINAGDAQLPRLNSTDQTRVRAQARREACKRDREQALSALQSNLGKATVNDARSRPFKPGRAGCFQVKEWQDSLRSPEDGIESLSENTAESVDSAASQDIRVAVAPNAESEAIALCLPRVVPAMYSPAVTQQALNAAFIEGHFCKSTYRMFGDVSQQAKAVIPRSRAWAASVNALGLLQLNSTVHSPRLAEEGQRYYIQILNSLQEELESSNLELAAIVGTVNHLLLCETYSAIPQTAPSRRNHFAGMATLIDRMGSPSHGAPLSALMLRSAQVVLLSRALVIRDSGPIQSIFRRTRYQQCHGSVLEQLLHHAMHVPFLIQEADRACEPRSRTKPLLPMMEKIISLISALDNWRKGNALFEIVDQGSPTSASVAPHMSLRPCLARLVQVFGRPLGFQSFNAANTCALYWTVVLLLRMSLYDLTVKATSRRDSAALDAVTDRDLKVECFACATLLCKSIPFLLQEAGGNISQAASIRAPLHFAQLCFHSIKSNLELKCNRRVESEMRAHFSSLNWDALLPWSFLALIWQTT